jgi:hypothetical protein
MSPKKKVIFKLTAVVHRDNVDWLLDLIHNENGRNCGVYKLRHGTKGKFITVRIWGSKGTIFNVRHYMLTELGPHITHEVIGLKEGENF